MWANHGGGNVRRPDHAGALQGTEKMGPQTAGTEHSAHISPPCSFLNPRLWPIAARTPRPKPSEPPDGITQGRPGAALPAVVATLKVM